MSPEIQGVLVGVLIGSTSSLIGFFVCHMLAIKRNKYYIKLEAEREFRKRLTDGISPAIYNKGMEMLYTLIDEGKLPQSYAMDPKIIDDLLEEISEGK